MQNSDMIRITIVIRVIQLFRATFRRLRGNEKSEVEVSFPRGLDFSFETKGKLPTSKFHPAPVGEGGTLSSKEHKIPTHGTQTTFESQVHIMQKKNPKRAHIKQHANQR